MPTVAAAKCLVFGSLKFPFDFKIVSWAHKSFAILIGTNHHLALSTRNIHHHFIETTLTEGKDIAHQSHFIRRTVNRNMCNSCKQYHNYKFTVLIYLS